jgi:succinate dehydrogenase / fumarate reductase flavoprotein subunit
LIAGRRAGEAAAAFSLEGEVFRRSRPAIDEGLAELEALTRPGTELARPLQRRLRDTMWESCGVVRTEAGLLEGLDAVAALHESAENVDVRPGSEGWIDLAHALDLRAGLVAAEATLRSAIERRETRGAQIRSDFADLDPALRVNFYVDARLAPWPEPVPSVPDYLLAWTEEPVEASAGRLLE